MRLRDAKWIHCQWRRAVRGHNNSRSSSQSLWLDRCKASQDPMIPYWRVRITMQMQSNRITLSLSSSENFKRPGIKINQQHLHVPTAASKFVVERPSNQLCHSWPSVRVENLHTFTAASDAWHAWHQHTMWRFSQAPWCGCCEQMEHYLMVTPEQSTWIQGHLDSNGSDLVRMDQQVSKEWRTRAVPMLSCVWLPLMQNLWTTSCRTE